MKNKKNYCAYSLVEVMFLKPKKKPQGIRGLNNQTIKEKNLEQNVRTEIAKEIKPSKIK